MAAKIMLVEDDTNLSEIYQARLEAEGFNIISAKDGEEALAMAVKERPDLIISDVMMPKISGFDMLDILRGTEGIKYTKVIMMTALGQAEDKARADKLGADRYLVKSQVTLEDVIKAVHDVLEGEGSANPAQQATTTVPANPATPTQPVATTPNPPGTPIVTPIAVTIPSDGQTAGPTSSSIPPTAPVQATVTTQPTQSSTIAQTTVNDSAPIAAEQAAVETQINSFIQNQTSQPSVSQPTNDATNPTVQTESKPDVTPPVANVNPNPGSVAIAGKKVIQPLNDVTTKKPDINALLAAEERKEAMTPLPAGPIVNGVPTNTQTPISGTSSDPNQFNPTDIAL